MKPEHIPFEHIARDTLAKLPDRSEEDEQQRLVRDRIDRADRLAEFERAVGERLASSTLANFVCKEAGQSHVVASLDEYATNMIAEVAAGAGIILFGPSGSGKDHLLTSLGRIAIGKYGLHVTWRNGADLLGELRDRISENEAEETWVRRLARPDVLYISDPSPPKGELTTYQSSMLGRVLDRRNRGTPRRLRRSLEFRLLTGCVLKQLPRFVAGRAGGSRGAFGMENGIGRKYHGNAFIL
jgi:hypothetical protein